jgi:uncharacterized Fe-S cluster-containing MiaB family protein
MKSVTYISTSCIPRDETASTAEISQLLESSRSYNTKSAISGVLLFTAQSFLQVLEGPAAEIATLFERIQCLTIATSPSATFPTGPWPL